MRKQRLSNSLTKCDDFLGEGFNAVCQSDQISDKAQRAARIATTRRQKETVLEELAAIYNNERLRFLDNRAIEGERFDDTCLRSFFDDARAQQCPIPITSLRGKDGSPRTDQAGMNRVATAFWLGKGGLFNKGTTRDLGSEAVLLDAVRREA